MAVRSAIRRILRDLASDDEDISTYAAMSVLRLKEVTEDEIADLLPPLRSSTSDPSISVRFFSKKALNEMKLQMARYPRFRDELDRLRDETRKTSWHDLLANLQNEETEAKLVVIDFLRDVEDPLLPGALADFIDRETDPFVIAEAIKVLGILGSKESVDFLEKYLSHRDSRIRSNAVEAMAEIGGKEVMRSILPLLEDDDNRVKATVAKICSHHGEHQVVATLATMLHSVEIWMRESATYALGHVPCGESVDLLLEAVCDVNPEIQRKAIESLGRLGATKAREFLTTIVSSGDPAVAQAAQAALTKIKAHGRDFPYFDPDTAARGPIGGPSVTTRRNPRHENPDPPVREDHSGKASLATRAFNLISSARNEVEEEMGAILRERANLVADLGRKTLDLYREGKLERPYLQEAGNEVKKLRYLIEQKETQKKDLKDETEKTTFLSFIKESVSRFTQEKQVDSRMEVLSAQLREVHVRVGTRALKDLEAEDMETLRFDPAVSGIHKIDRQLEAMQNNLTTTAP